jgi:hypothetical protein
MAESERLIRPRRHHRHRHRPRLFSHRHWRIVIGSLSARAFAFSLGRLAVWVGLVGGGGVTPLPSGPA